MHRILIILFTFCFLFSLRLCGACPEEQVEFANRKLKQLAGQLPISVFRKRIPLWKSPKL